MNTKGETMQNRQYRQGDVFLVRVAKPRATRKSIGRVNGRIVLAYGEVTGHAHAIKDVRADLFEAAGKTYLAIDGDVVALEHEEHGTIEIPAGYYEVVRQREYHPDAIRTVAD